MTETEKDYAKAIGQFYLAKNHNDYLATEKEILYLNIVKIEFTDEKLSITTSYPGKLIGKRGANIDALTNYLNVHVKIIEDQERLNEFLIPIEEEE